MTIGAIYLFVLIPAVALIGGALAVRSTQRSADRVRAAQAKKQKAAGHGAS